MRYSDNGAEVTLTLEEYGALRGEIEKIERLASARIEAAEKSARDAERLRDEAINKEPLVRYQDDLKNALNLREDAASQMVRMAEHFMQEVYHVMGNVSRTNRTELENRMKKLRGL